MFEAARSAMEARPTTSPRTSATGSRCPGDPGTRRAGIEANARTGNVPVPVTGAGTALNQAPSTGTAARFVRCSQIGMPAASRPECAGRVRSAGSSMLSESMATIAAPSRTSRSTAAAVRKVVAAVGLGSPVAVEPRVHQDGLAGEVVGEQGRCVNGERRRARDIDAHGGHVHQAFQRQPGEVGSIS